MNFKSLRIPLACGFLISSTISIYIVFIFFPIADYYKTAAGFLLGGMFSTSFITLILDREGQFE